ncbi:MAG: plastocyanin/azurin family copper-binding protein [Thermoplasmata archaeon]
MSDAPTARRPRVRGRAIPWLIAALLLTTIGLPTVAALGRLPTVAEVGEARPLSANVSLSVNLTDTPAFSPRYLTAPAGSSVSIHIENIGIYDHTFTLAAKPNVALSPTLSPVQVYDFFETNGSLANVSVDPGGQAWANVTFNASLGLSSFEFVSVVPYQFQAGMWGLLNLSSTGPGLGLSENTTDALAFVPNVLSASPAHYPVVVDVLVTNLGSFAHTFTIAPQSNVSLSPANFTQYFQQHAPLASVNVPTGAGATVWANFTVTGPGVYQYICEIPGHFADGMSGLLYVGVSVPASIAPPSTAIVEVWVLVGSAVLLGIGVALAAVAAFTGRFPRPPGAHGGHGHT